MTADQEDLRFDLEREAERLERRFAENPQGRVFAPLADKYRQLGRLEEAEGLVLEGLKRHPDYLGAYLVLGKIYVDLGRPGDALAQFTRVLELDPQNLVALRALGDVAAMQGDWFEARRRYREILDMDPHNEEVVAALASLPAAGGEGGEGQGVAGVEEGPLSGYSRYSEEFVEEAPEPAEPEAAPTPGEPAVPESMAPSAAEWPPEPAPAPIEEMAPSTGAAAPAGLEPPAVEEMVEGPPTLGPMGEVAPGVGTPTPGEIDAPLITETMAELYADQGLYEDAIDIYRSLLDQRPGDPNIQRRIAELERLAAQKAAATAPPPMGPEELLAREPPATPEIPVGPTAPVEERLPPIQEEAPLPDWLAGPAEEEVAPPEPSAARGAPEALGAAEGPVPRDSFAASFDEAAAVGREAAMAAVESEPVAGPAAAPAVSATIGEYLRALLAYGEPGARARGTPQPASPAAPAAPQAERAAAPGTTPPPSPSAAAPGGGELDDDLAQFQAWLRSLKR